MRKSDYRFYAIQFFLQPEEFDSSEYGDLTADEIIEVRSQHYDEQESFLAFKEFLGSINLKMESINEEIGLQVIVFPISDKPLLEEYYKDVLQKPMPTPRKATQGEYLRLIKRC